MDEDAAAAAGQLFGSGPAGLLVIDHRELLMSTARVVGAKLGELEFKVWMALVTIFVASGMPRDGRCGSTIGELGGLIWRPGMARGGNETHRLLKALFDLRQARFTVPGYDMVNQRPAPGASDTSLLINVYVDEALLKSYRAATGQEGAPLNPATKGALGARSRETIAWRLHPDYSQRLAESDLRRFDWAKAQRLRGVALAMWMSMTSPRYPYRPRLEDPRTEVVEVPLTVEHCNALGVRTATDAARRRTLNQAGVRVCEADRSFLAFEAHGGRGRESFLRVVRQAGGGGTVERPYGEQQQLAIASTD
jgi:hypothetical protein